LPFDAGYWCFADIGTNGRELRDYTLGLAHDLCGVSTYHTSHFGSGFILPSRKSTAEPRTLAFAQANHSLVLAGLYHPPVSNLFVRRRVGFLGFVCLSRWLPLRDALDIRAYRKTVRLPFRTYSIRIDYGQSTKPTSFEPT